MNRTSRILIALAAAQAAAVAQAPLWTNSGSLNNSRHGFAVKVIDDYNGNGTRDVLIGEPGDLGAAFAPGGGSVMVRDGNGTCITIFYGLQSRGMGTGLGTLPDINGDGIDEIILGSPIRAAFGTNFNGRVSVYLGGRDGGGAPGCAGSSYATPDLVIDKGISPVLNADEFGVEIEPIGDLDGDGLVDFAVGAPYGNLSLIPNDHRGYVEVYSSSLVFGGPIQPLYTLNGPSPNSRFGEEICSMGDVNDDGIADFVVGSPDESIGSDAFNGRVRFYDGATGALFLTLTGLNGHRLGTSIENVGDLDGDGRDDIAFGVPYDRSTPTTPASGSVSVIRGSFIRNQALGTVATPILYDTVPKLFEAFGDVHYGPTGLGPNQDGFGWSIANAGDLDNDGINDVLVGAPGASLWHPDSVLFGNWPFNYDAIQCGMARLVSGATGNTIKQYFSTTPDTADSYGASVAAGGDLNGDGVNDLVIASPWNEAGATNNGTVFTYSGVTEFGVVYGSGNPNSTGTAGSIAARGSANVAANNLRIDIANCPPNASGILIMSDTQQVPGSMLGNGLLYLSGSIIRFPVVTTFDDGSASYQIDLNLPPATANLLSLSRWNFQFWHRDVGGTVNLTDALTVGFY